MSRAVLGTDLDQRDELGIDLERLLVTRLLVQANSGAGKSYTVRRLLEQAFPFAPQVVIDIDGEYHTLREAFPYVLASAGAGGDCRIDVRTAGLFARRVLEHGFSAVVDISEMKALERMRFVRAFLEELMEAPRKLWRPLLVVVDEAHVYCPEKGSAESAGAVIDLMTRGRKRGFCGVLATQRISKLHKDAAAEANKCPLAYVRLIGAPLLVGRRKAEQSSGLLREQSDDLLAPPVHELRRLDVEVLDRRPLFIPQGLARALFLLLDVLAAKPPREIDDGCGGEDFEKVFLFHGDCSTAVGKGGASLASARLTP